MANNSQYAQQNLLIPIVIALGKSGKPMETSELYPVLTEMLQPWGKDLEPYSGRKDTIFSQTIRNFTAPERLTDFNKKFVKKEGDKLSLTDFGQKVFDAIFSKGTGISAKKNMTKYPVQVIYYGAPGTGKSYEINRITKNKEVIRTTFHPDSDYSTFVGAYKPTSIAVPMRDVTGKVIIENGQKVTENRIIYEFVPQAFMQAYVNAWKLYAKAGETDMPSDPEEQYLIIEEINRGNCAQIFGDIFQLLDRGDNGFSCYPIQADKDIQKHLAKEFANIEFPSSLASEFDGYVGNISEDLKSGKVLVLPNNLYIWATMNTSDQSLFPIDSAFKRRWDWVYRPIGYKNSNWTIEIGDKKYNWVDFQKAINQKIYDVDNSEDKQLGDYFVNADRTGYKISADTLLNKILFYIWNDVCKDDPDQIFRCKTNKEEESVKFSDFFGADKINKLQGFMAFNGVSAIGEFENTLDAPQDTEGIYADDTHAEEDNDEVNA